MAVKILTNVLIKLIRVHNMRFVETLMGLTSVYANVVSQEME